MKWCWGFREKYSEQWNWYEKLFSILQRSTRWNRTYWPTNSIFNANELRVDLKSKAWKIVVAMKQNMHRHRMIISPQWLALPLHLLSKILAIWFLLSKQTHGLSTCKKSKRLYKWAAVLGMVQENICFKNKAFVTNTSCYWWNGSHGANSMSLLYKLLS